MMECEEIKFDTGSEYIACIDEDGFLIDIKIVKKPRGLLKRKTMKKELIKISCNHFIR
jgi:hypothetical protein